MKREATAQPKKRHEEMLEHLTSDASLRPKDDALLFEHTVNHTGGPETPWAKAVRRGIQHESDPLRQQHRAEMAERFMARGYAVTQLLDKNRDQRERAEKLDEPKREKRLAAFAAGQRRDMDTIDEQFALESFISWSIRKRNEVEREAPFLERHAEREAERQAQWIAHDGLKREVIAPRPSVESPRPERSPELAPSVQPIEEWVEQYQEHAKTQALEAAERERQQKIDQSRGISRGGRGM